MKEMKNRCTKVKIHRIWAYLLLTGSTLHFVPNCVQVTYLGKQLLKYASEEVPSPPSPRHPHLPGMCQPNLTLLRATPACLSV